MYQSYNSCPSCINPTVSIVFGVDLFYYLSTHSWKVTLHSYSFLCQFLWCGDAVPPMLTNLLSTPDLSTRYYVPEI